jgi:antitoxin component YwqK of YwqJK toxin-antitoxin module
MNSIHPSSASPRARWGKRLLFIVAVLGVAGLAWFLNHTPRTAPSGPAENKVEVLRAELELKTGRLHRIGSPTPFTGSMLERSADGSLRSRSAISNGLLHGLSEGWHTNGQIQVAEQFKEGISHGQRTKWYADGAKLSEAMIANGQLHGSFRRWHTNGEMAEEVQLKDGQSDGLSKAYFPSGFMKSRAMMRSGKVVDQKFWKDGEYRESMAQLAMPTAPAVAP